MFETFPYPAVLRRQQDGPLAAERAAYLKGLAGIMWRRSGSQPHPAWAANRRPLTNTDADVRPPSHCSRPASVSRAPP
jgi:hypothetical protein